MWLCNIHIYLSCDPLPPPPPPLSLPLSLFLSFSQTKLGLKNCIFCSSAMYLSVYVADVVLCSVFPIQQSGAVAEGVVGLSIPPVPLTHTCFLVVVHLSSLFCVKATSKIRLHSSLSCSPRPVRLSFCWDCVFSMRRF